MEPAKEQQNEGYGTALSTRLIRCLEARKIKQKGSVYQKRSVPEQRHLLRKDNSNETEERLRVITVDVH